MSCNSNIYEGVYHRETDGNNDLWLSLVNI